ncbi:hypothetical protein DFH06DRAFT_1365384 [Mycena polygramma]|nr:hypothetical protein DFH06DRAFT_1365384 [Mycena polygramma]
MLFATSVILSAVLAVSATPLVARQAESVNGQTVSIVAHSGSIAWTYPSQVNGAPLGVTAENGSGVKSFLLQTVTGQNDSATVIMTYVAFAECWKLTKSCCSAPQQLAGAPTVVALDTVTNRLYFVPYAATNPLACKWRVPVGMPTTGLNGLASQCSIRTQGKCVAVVTTASGENLSPAECDGSASQTWDLVKVETVTLTPHLQR